MFGHVHRRTIAWGECDPAGIVFYPRFFEMFDAATAALFEAATGMSRAKLVAHYDILGWPMVSSQADFRATASFDDAVEIRTDVRRLGRTSVELEHVLRRGDTVCVTSREIRIWAKYGSSAGAVVPEPLPEQLRRQLGEQEGNG